MTSDAENNTLVTPLTDDFTLSDDQQVKRLEPEIRQ